MIAPSLFSLVCASHPVFRTDVLACLRARRLERLVVRVRAPN